MVLFIKTWLLSFGLKTSGKALQTALCLHVSVPERRSRPWRPRSDVLPLPELEETKHTSYIMKFIKENALINQSVFTELLLCASSCARCQRSSGKQDIFCLRGSYSSEKEDERIYKQDSISSKRQEQEKSVKGEDHTFRMILCVKTATF